MKRERFKSSKGLVIYVAIVASLIVGTANYADWTSYDYLEGGAVAAFLVLLALYSTLTTYLEIHDSRTLINSGYRTFGKDTIDIFDIKYIYRHPEFIIRYYGSRMVFYIKGEDGRLRRSSLREVNFANDTLVRFLKRIKEIRPTIELDPEYEKIIKGEMDLNDASGNTVASVEARLRAKGETWS
jgi:hypothetical protein